MVIRIVYKDNVHDYVNDVLLNRFLEAGKIARFQRRTGWVTVGKDSVRTGKQTAFRGAERRTGRGVAPRLKEQGSVKLNLTKCVFVTLKCRDRMTAFPGAGRT